MIELSVIPEGTFDFAIEPGDTATLDRRGRPSVQETVCPHVDHPTTELFVPMQRANANKGELEIGRSGDGMAERAGDATGCRRENENALNDDSV